MAHTVMIDGQPHTFSAARGGYVANKPKNGPHIGQCDGCPAGSSVLCSGCGLCTGHCNSNGCGYSPHASEAYAYDDEYGF